ncbi:MAG: DUF1847 domain-containing protein [Bacillota bacterium]
MSICAWCETRACRDPDKGTRPRLCPMREGEWLERALEHYEKPENRRLAQIAAHIEKTGYCEWPRLKEITELCRSAEFKRIGLAFCSGIHKEARVVADYFRNHGFEVISGMCKTGSVDKAELGIAPEDRFNPEGFEAMCNPIGQAELMNEQKTDFNVVLGLCVGHDSLFFKHSDAPVTVLAAKDRVLGHNPLAAVYLADSYYRKLHEPEE